MCRLSVIVFLILAHGQLVLGSDTCESKLADKFEQHRNEQRKNERRKYINSIGISLLGHGLLVGGIIFNNVRGKEDIEIEFAGHSGESDAIQAMLITGTVVPSPPAEEEQEEEKESQAAPPSEPVAQTKPQEKSERVAEPKPEPEPEPEPVTPPQKVVQAKPAVQESAPQENVPQETEPTQAAMITTVTEESLLSLRESLDKFIVYPQVAKQNEITGTVVVGFEVQKDGRIHELHVVDSSGFQILDKEAMRAMQQLARIWSYPGSQSDLNRGPYNVLYPIEFKLNRN
jgi:periplasmic protein TonB